MQIQIYETLVVQMRGEVHGVPGAKLCCGSGEDSGLNLECLLQAHAGTHAP